MLGLEKEDVLLVLSAEVVWMMNTTTKLTPDGVRDILVSTTLTKLRNYPLSYPSYVSDELVPEFSLLQLP